MTSNSRVISYGKPSWRLFLLLVWATWWGGIFFYASVVVPIGSESIGSLGQGFVTQQVSRIHNLLSLAFLVCLVLESIRLRSAFVGILTILLSINVLLLFLWHSHLTNAMNFQVHSVPSTFYKQHAIYLWLTASEWILGMVTAAILFRTTQPADSTIQNNHAE